jgi:hypothetical protein
MMNVGNFITMLPQCEIKISLTCEENEKKFLVLNIGSVLSLSPCNDAHILRYRFEESEIDLRFKSLHLHF